MTAKLGRVEAAIHEIEVEYEKLAAELESKDDEVVALKEKVCWNLWNSFEIGEVWWKNCKSNS